MSGRTGDLKGTLCFVFWFHWGAEVRSFLFSGLIEELSRTCDVVVVTRKIPSHAGEVTGEGVKFRQLQDVPIRRIHGWLTTLANHAHQKWLERRKEALAVADRAAVPHHAVGWRRKSKDFLGGILGREAAIRSLGRMEAMMERGMARGLDPLIPTNAREVILVSGDYLSPAGAGMAAAVAAGGGTTIFYPLNWRDVYKGARFRRRFTGWWFWNEDMRRTALSFNPGLQQTGTRAVGALQFDGHFRETWKEDREVFLGSMGLDPSRPVVCYSAVAEDAFSGEAAMVVAIFGAIAGLILPVVLGVQASQAQLIGSAVAVAGCALGISFPARTLKAILTGSQHITTVRIADFALLLCRTVLILLLLAAGQGLMALLFATLVSVVARNFVFFQLVA